MLNIKKLSKLITFIIIFHFLIYITIASSECPYKVEGKDASIIDNCFIKTSEVSPLKIIFTECKNIKIRYYEFAENDNGPIYDKFPGHLIPGNIIEKNMVIYNNNSKGLSNFIPITYIPWITCDNQRDRYKPHIKVYPHKDELFAVVQPQKNIPPKWVSNINSFIINETKTINLSNYFLDEDNDTLTYTITPSHIANVSIIIENEIVEITPEDFTDNTTIIFSASDGKIKYDKKIKLIFINKLETQENGKEWINILKSYTLKYWKIIGIILLLILGMIYAKVKWKTRWIDSIKGVFKTAVRVFENFIRKYGITKPKKQKSKS